MYSLRQSFISIFILSLLLAGCQPQQPQFHDQYGQPLHLSGNWLVLHYWATWCGPCRKEVPELNLLHKEVEAKGVLVLGANYDQLRDLALQDAIKELDIHFPVLLEAPDKHFALPASQGIPVTYIINPKGQLAATLLGEQNRQSIINTLRKFSALP